MGKSSKDEGNAPRGKSDITASTGAIVITGLALLLSYEGSREPLEKRIARSPSKPA